MKMNNLNGIVFVLLLIVPLLSASEGDRTEFFRNCRENCERQNCSADGVDILEHAAKHYRQTIFDWTWTCSDECQYGCAWRTVDAFLERKWKVPQFYGKWPFIRFLGFQEPASVVFSLLNLVTHMRMLKEFRDEVANDSPCYKLWHCFNLVCCNGWIWSIVFHAKDFPFSELMDYVSAYSMVLMLLYCFAHRMLLNYNITVRFLVGTGFATFFLNHVAYLASGPFSYAYNMKLNVATGVLSAIGWISWSLIEQKTRPYAKGIIHFYVLLGMAMSLELLDFPPIYWVFDAHSIWHLATVPIIPILYNFIIDDCIALRKEKKLSERNLRKRI